MVMTEDIPPDPRIEAILSAGTPLRYVLGVDLGQSNDPSAIAVLEYTEAYQDPYAYKRAPDRFDVRHLERLPLGCHIQRLPDMCERCCRGRRCVQPTAFRVASEGSATLVIDETGVGRAVGDIFEHAGLEPVRVTITGGNEVTQPLRDHWHVSKTTLVSTVDALLHTGELRFAADLVEASAMRDELLDFRRHLSAAGRATYEARSGKHDDLVLAVAIACWWLRLPPLMPRVVLGGY
jgi:hypothetical protein